MPPRSSKPRIVRADPKKREHLLGRRLEEARLGTKADYGTSLHDLKCTTVINKCVETFGAEISEELLTLLSKKKRQILGQSELIPCHVAQFITRD